MIKTAALVKIASALVHAHEGRAAGQHYFDWHTFDTLMSDPEVIEGLAEMERLSLLPCRRDNSSFYRDALAEVTKGGRP